jgi:iron complex outermembrane receptor protein
MVLLDGVPLSLGWDHRTDPSLIPVTGSENIVIVRGLGSLLNGPNTLGGTIDVSHAWNAAASRNGVWAGAGVDDNSAVVTTAGVTRRTEAGGGALLLQGGVAYRNRDGYSLPEDAPDATPHDGLRTNSDLRHVDGFASLRWRNEAGRGFGLTSMWEWDTTAAS